jgi:cyclic nucleotide-binding protein
MTRLWLQHGTKPAFLKAASTCKEADGEFRVSTLCQKTGVVRSYRRNSEISREEDATDRVYEVISGTVCTCKILKQGRRQIAGFYFASDLLSTNVPPGHSDYLGLTIET